jgi:hypothetical protein
MNEEINSYSGSDDFDKLIDESFGGYNEKTVKWEVESEQESDEGSSD